MQMVGKGGGHFEIITVLFSLKGGGLSHISEENNIMSVS